MGKAMLTQILSGFGALGGLAGLVVLLTYIRDRRSVQIRDDISEATQDDHIEAVAISNLEKKLVYLERLVDTLTKQNERLEERDARRLARIQELEDRLDATMQSMRQMKRELEELKDDRPNDSATPGPR